MIELMHGDCLELMQGLLPGSVDMVLCDLPYGTTRLPWNEIVPFPEMWRLLDLACKPSAAMVFTASQPFTTKLIASNMEAFRYCWVWEKNNSTGFINAKLAPIKKHEDVCVFYRQKTTYNPQGIVPSNKILTLRKRTGLGMKYNMDKDGYVGSREYTQMHTNYPTSILEFSRDSDLIHPTQKPVALMEYLIRTYTDEGQLVLDMCAGSGTTGVAALNAGRRCVLMERDDLFFGRMEERISKHAKKERLF